MAHPCVSLPTNCWPPNDRPLWEEANRVGDPLDPDGRATLWAQNTRQQVEKDYGRFLFWLSRTNRLDENQLPGARLTATCLGAYLSHLRDTGMASTSQLSRLRGLLQAISVLDPEADVSHLRRVCARLKRLAVPSRQKHLRLVHPAVLVDAALAEYDKLARAGNSIPIRACNHARDAFMLAFLACHPIRLANFADLLLKQHVSFIDSGIKLALKAHEPKERRAYHSMLDLDLLPYMDHYMADVRPRLLDGQECDHLWVSMRGRPLSKSAIYSQIIKITKRLVGHAINPHLIRDCAMTALAEDAPASVRAGARLLGHADLRTGEEHYNHASTFAAQRAYFDVISSYRADPDQKQRGR